MEILVQTTKNKIMTASQILTNGQKGVKPVFLLTKEEIIAERDKMESNWSDEMAPRMRDLTRASMLTYKTILSNLK